MMRRITLVRALSGWAIIACCVVAGVLASPSAGLGQGFLIGPHPMPRPWRHPRPPHPHPRPRPAASYQVTSLSVKARVGNQIARVEVEQTFVNRGSRVLEASFIFPLPYDGAVDRMTFMVDGEELPGKLLDADEAARIFQNYVRKNQDPALLQWVGHGIFRTRVFPIPPGKKRTVSLRYTQVLRKEFGLTELAIPLRPAQFTQQPLESLTISATIRSNTPIKNVYSPSHQVKVERKKGKLVRVTFSAERAVPLEDFRLMYDVGKESVSTKVVSYRPSGDEDGYFLMLISPELPGETDEVQPKTVIFVLDRSGSMSGKKIKQARNALRFVLRNLHEGDLFNIIAYDSEVESFQPELQRFDKEQLDEALAFVDGIESGGSTNLTGALLRAMKMVPDDSDRPAYVVFLTDGRPTAGVTREPKIVQAAADANRAAARLYTFGLGFDVNSRLLDKLAGGNRGYTVYVKPDEDIEVSVAKLYRRIEAPALVDVKFDIDVPVKRKKPAANATYRVYPREVADLFAGDQLVVVGRYRRAGKVKVTIRGKLLGKPHTYDFGGRFVDQSKDDTHAYVEKLWAVRRIGEIIDEIDLHGENKELVEELVRLAKQHGILTPYTSFLADEHNAWDDVAGQNRAAGELLGMLKQSSGRSGFAQRRAKNEMKLADRAAPSSQPYGDGGFGYGGGPPGGMAGGRGVGGFGGGGFGGGGFGGGGFGGGGLGGGGGGGFGGAGMGGQASPPGDAEAREGQLGGAPVRTVGRWTFYRRQGRWIASDLKEAEIKRAKQMEKLSDEAMALMRKHGASLAQALALEGSVVVKLGKEVIEFKVKEESAKSEPKASRK